MRGVSRNAARDRPCRSFFLLAASGSACRSRRRPGRGGRRLRCRGRGRCCRSGRGLGGGRLSRSRLGGGRGPCSRRPFRRRLSPRGRRRGHAVQLDENRIRDQARRSRLGFAGRVLAALGGADHPHRNGLWLVAGEREAHCEFGAGHRHGAGGPARLSERRAGLRAGGFGFELHGGRGRRRRRRIGLHPARKAGASGEAQTARCDCNDSFHDPSRPLSGRGHAGSRSGGLP